MDQDKLAKFNKRQTKLKVAETKLTIGLYCLYTGKAWDEVKDMPLSDTNFLVKVKQYDRLSEMQMLLSVMGASQNDKSYKSYMKLLEKQMEEIKLSL